MQLENECCRHQSAEGNGWVASLQSPERIAAHEQPRRHFTRGNAALASSQREIAPQLAERLRRWLGD